MVQLRILSVTVALAVILGIVVEVVDELRGEQAGRGGWLGAARLARLLQGR